MWFGKLLGGLFGFLLGDWLGALCGVILGHAFDYGRQAPRWLRWPSLRWPSLRWPSFGVLRRRRRQLLLWAFFGVMGRLAKADGRVSPQEIAATETAMRQLGLSPTQRRSAIKHFNRGKANGFPLNQALEVLRLQTRRQRGELQQLLQHLWLLAYANGAPTPPQLALLQQVRQRLRLAPAEFEMLHQRARRSAGYERGEARNPATGDPLAAAYQTLGVSRDASDEAVKKAYRRLMSQHHPDKLSASGLSERALERAKSKTQEIQQAYQQIRKARGR